MRMTIVWSVLPLLFVAGSTMAQEAAPAAEPAAAVAPAVAAEPVQARERTTSRASVQRQGADMRHCLKLKDSRAIIRCAEPGRKP